MAITLFSDATQSIKDFFKPAPVAEQEKSSVVVNTGLSAFYNNFSTKTQPQFIPQLSYFFKIAIDFIPVNSNIKSILFNNNKGIQPDQFGLFVRSITIPGITSTQTTDSVIQTQLGQGLITGKIAIPDNFEFDIDFLSTGAALHDTVFYPWILETATPEWLYAERPYTLANITVTTLRSVLNKSAKNEDNQWITAPGTEYYFRGVVPTRIEMPSFTHVDQNVLVRKVTFKFSNMFIVPPRIIPANQDNLVPTKK